MDRLTFDKNYNVHVYETGPDGRLNLLSLFNYFQDIASDHAELLGFGRDDLMKDNRFWVLSRMYAEIKVNGLWKKYNCKNGQTEQTSSLPFETMM
jgi:hypothetical protein